jgi:hypothetical protein
MKETEIIPEFSLQGGPVHWLGCRLGLVKGTNTFPLGLALGLFTWGIMMVFVLINGMFLKAFSITYIGAHVRLAIAIPLLFLAETWVLPRMSEFIRNIVDSGMVKEKDLPELSRDIRRIEKLKDFWMLEIFFVLVAIILPMILRLPGMTGAQESIEKLAVHGSIWTKIWYTSFCLPLFRYLILRWLWYLILWWYFLWRVQKLELNLIPTHPDRSAGLGYLEVVQMHFAPLIVASSAIFATAFAENISSGVMKFEALYHLVPTVILIYAVLFICPLYIFSGKLWQTKIKGLNEYMVMAHHYVDAFDRKWLRGQNPTGEEQLGTGDIQSLADLNNSVSIIGDMRIIPTSRKLIVSFAITSIIPMLPLLLLKYPLLQIVGALLNILSGQ